METINQKVKEEDTDTLRKKVVTVYGSVELDKDEMSFLSLGPDFLLVEDLCLEKAKLDFDIAVTKVKWQRMGLDPCEVVRY